MNTKKIYLSTVAALLLASCAVDVQPEQALIPDPVDEDLVPVEFSVSEMVNFTRAGSSIVSFNSGEAVKVCVSTDGGSNYTGYDFTTAAAGQSVGLDAPATPPYFPVGEGTTVKAYAYYPSTAGEAATFSVAADQTSDDDYKASDLMYAAVRTITKGSTEGTTLAMAHLMAQLHLNITGSGLTVRRVLVNAQRTVSFTPATGAATATGDASDIVAAVADNENTAAGHSYVCIPQQPINSVTVKVEAGDPGVASTTATFTFTSTDNFVAGNSYPINLTVNATQLGATTAIADWNGQQAVTIAPSGDMTIDDIDPVTYDGSAHTFSVTVRKSGETDPVSTSNYDLTWINNTNAGTGVVVATGKGNYTGSVAVATFTINKAPGSISYASATETKTYGNSAFTKTLSKTGDGTVTYSCSPAGVATVNESTGAITITGAGSTTITATVADGANYTYAANTASYTLTVNPAALTLTADNKSKTYGAANPTFTFTASGFVNGETTSVLTTQPSLSTTANASSAVGTYPITISGATAANYTITYVEGTLTVNKAATTVATTPTKAENWTADGSAHNLLAAAGAASTGGTMYYYSSTTNSTPATNASGWSTTIPTATAAGTYYVWYYAKGDSNHSDSSVGGPLTITVIGVNPSSLQLGDIIYADGTSSRNNALNTSKTAVGVVVYVASSTGAAECEAGKTCRSGSGTVVGKVLVMSLQDISSTQKWYTSNADDHDNTLFPNCSNNKTTASSDYRGYEKTKQMATKTGACASHTHAAATEAWNYVPSGATSSSAYLTGSTGWFLPSIGQWFKVFQAMAGAASVSTTVPDAGSWSGNGTVASKLSTYITNAGGNASTLVGSYSYWGSSECSDASAQFVRWYTGSSNGFSWDYYLKSSAYYVRPFLAY